MMFILSMMMIMSIQPILMVIGLIMLSLLYSMYIYMNMGSYWFSYMMIMVMLSGVFVVFSYMSSLSPNESFEIFEVVFMGSFMILMECYMMIEFSFKTDYISMGLWMEWMSVFSMFLVVFLFMIMVLVMWMSNKKVGAIRVNWWYAWVKG